MKQILQHRFLDDPAITWNSISVTNGKFPVQNVSLSTSIFNAIDASIKSSCGLEGASLTFELATEIQDGTLRYGLKTNTSGDLELYYRLEKNLWSSADGTETFKVYVQITYTIRKTIYPNASGEPVVEYDYSPILEIDAQTAATVALIAVVAIAIIAIGVASGGPLPSLLLAAAAI